MKLPTRPLFLAAGIKPTPWNIEDSLAVFYLMSWNSAANLDTEIIAQMLVEKLGPENLPPESERAWRPHANTFEQTVNL